MCEKVTDFWLRATQSIVPASRDCEARAHTRAGCCLCCMRQLCCSSCYIVECYSCYVCVCISLCICLDYSATHIPPTGGRHMGGRAEGARRVDAHARTHAHTHAGLWALNSLGREWKDCEDELECGARSWGGGVGERGVGGGWGASGLAWPSPGRGLRRPGSEVRPPPPRARSL